MKPNFLPIAVLPVLKNNTYDPKPHISHANPMMYNVYFTSCHCHVMTIFSYNYTEWPAILFFFVVP